MDGALRPAAGTQRPEPAAAFAGEDAFGKDAARRIAGTEKENIENTLGLDRLVHRGVLLGGRLTLRAFRLPWRTAAAADWEGFRAPLPTAGTGGRRGSRRRSA